MQFRFTIFNDSLAPTGIAVPQPVGWKEAKLVLERHKDYHSLIEYFEVDLIFYGAGLILLQDIEDDQGPEAIVRIKMELSLTMGLWEELPRSLIDLSLLEEFSKGKKMYKMKVPVINDEPWAKFINRKSIPVDLSATVDLDGNERIPINPFTLPLPSQILRQNHESYLSDGLAITIRSSAPFGGLRYLQINNNIREQDEIKTIYNLSSDESVSVPTWEIEILYSGSYTFSILYELSFIELGSEAGYKSVEGVGLSLPDFDYLFNIQSNGQQFNADDSIAFDKQNESYSDGSPYNCWEDLINPSLKPDPETTPVNTTKYSFAGTFDLNKGDRIRIYGKSENRFWHVAAWGALGTPCIFREDNGESETNFDYLNYTGKPAGMDDRPTRMVITADTSFEDTETEAFLLPHAAESILSKIVGADEVMVSEMFETCKRLYSLQKGLHVRGYTLEEKPFALSFDDWWAGADPILNIGLGYTTDSKIQIEEKEYFYNKTPVVNLSNVANITRTYDTDKYLKSLEIGYQKWSAESESGVDDPQTKQFRRTKFATIGKDEKILSKFLAASLAIEQTRRNRVEQGKDWRLDEDVLIIALTEALEPETGDAFELIQNLLNPDTRYNIRLSCARNFERWRNWFNGCLQHTTGEKFYYASGEGNQDMFSELSEGDCDYGENPGLRENQDINVTGDFILIPKKYDFRHPLSWATYKQIRDNKNNALGLSRGTDAHTPHFIDKLEYYIVKGYGQFSVLLGAIPTEENGFRLLEDSNFRLLEDDNFLMLE